MGSPLPTAPARHRSGRCGRIQDGRVRESSLVDADPLGEAVTQVVVGQQSRSAVSVMNDRDLEPGTFRRLGLHQVAGVSDVAGDGRGYRCLFARSRAGGGHDRGMRCRNRPGRLPQAVQFHGLRSGRNPAVINVRSKQGKRLYIDGHAEHRLFAALIDLPSAPRSAQTVVICLSRLTRAEHQRMAQDEGDLVGAVRTGADSGRALGGPGRVRGSVRR